PALASAQQRAVLFVDVSSRSCSPTNKTRPKDEAERSTFIAQITRAAQQPDGKLIVLIALRSDFVSPCLAYPELSALLRGGFEPVTAMTPSELTRAIVQPALAVGLSIAPKLAAQVIAEMRGEPGTLPLMQFALRDLLDDKNPQPGDACELTLRDYLARGGIHQALQRHADAAFAKLDAAQKLLVRGLFARLISPGRGTADTRRIVQLAQLVPAGQPDAPTQTLVQALADVRLLTTDAGTVTIAHETLLEAWPWLVTLRKELRNEIELQNEISDDAGKWEANRRDAGYVYRDAQLAGVTKALDAGKLALDALSMDFVQAGRKRQARATNLRRGVVSVLVVLTLMAMGLAGWAMRQTEIANEKAEEARVNLEESQRQKVQAEQNLAESQRQQRLGRSRALAASATSEIATNSERALQIALEAEQEAHTFESENALRRAMATYLTMVAPIGGRANRGSVNEAFFSPNGGRIITHGSDYAVRLWDSESRKLIATFAGAEWSAYDAKFSINGKRLVTLNTDKIARLWDGESGELIAVLSDHQGNINSVRFSPDSRHIVTSSDDKTARLWDGESGKLITTLSGHEERVYDAQFSPNGRRIVTSSDDNTPRIWDSESGKHIATLARHEGVNWSAQFSSDSKRIITNTRSPNQAARLWDSESGNRIAILDNDEEGVYEAQFSPDGKRILTKNDNDVVRLWNGESGKFIFTLSENEAKVYDTQFSPDGERIVAQSDDNTIRMWDGQSGHIIAILSGHEERINSVQFSSDSKRIITSSDDKTARLWDSKSGKLVATLTGFDERVYSAQFSPDGERILTYSNNGTVSLWGAEPSNYIATLPGQEENYRNAKFSLDGKRIVTVNDNGTARIHFVYVEDLVAFAKAIAPRELTCRERGAVFEREPGVSVSRPDLAGGYE
ncbi:MAG: WD40 repeat domain-containing protein, partial [Anaerolineae bacterium]|nr:WD40 repeat domain-containing protein [Anaerolineae bacterium]